MCSLGIEPTTFALLTQCSNHWATSTLCLDSIAYYCVYSHIIVYMCTKCRMCRYGCIKCIDNGICLNSTLCTEYMYVYSAHCLLYKSVSMFCLYVNCFCTVWSTLSRISLTKAHVLWWCDNKSGLIWFEEEKKIPPLFICHTIYRVLNLIILMTDLNLFIF